MSGEGTAVAAQDLRDATVQGCNALIIPECNAAFVYLSNRIRIQTQHAISDTCDAPKLQKATYKSSF